MQIPVLSGVYSDEAGDFRVSYPVNLSPVILNSGINTGYLRPADGVVIFGNTQGPSRGGINWNGICFRVVGPKLISIATDGTPTVLGDVGGAGQVTFDYSFDRLAVCSAGRLYYWNGTTLTQVTDPNLGTVLDFCWVDGYFLATDGEFIFTSDITDPMVWSVLNYASSEIDPDPISSVMKLRNEVYAVNRYTIEVFDNVGGSGFPFQRIKGAQVQKGCVGTYASCVFLETIAFVGSGRNESTAIFLGVNAGANKISTREIDELLGRYTEVELSGILLETRNHKGQNHLWVHLPDRTLVYDSVSSQQVGESVWHVLTSSLSGFSPFLAKDLVWCYDKWLVGHKDIGLSGYLSDTVSSHWGERVRWEFGTSILYNAGKGAVIHSLELVCLSGRVEIGTSPTVTTSYSVDGEVWSTDRPVAVGGHGDRTKRIVWLRAGSMRHWRVQRFRGDSRAFLTIVRLEAELEALGA